jgi:hypothetical protein
MLLPLALAAGLWIWLVWIQPRPFHYPDTDMEHTYYFAARQAALGEKVWFFSHPGSPVTYPGGWLMRITGTDLSQTALFLRWTYALNALLLAVGVIVYDRCAQRALPTTVRAAGILAAFASPWVFRYTAQYGADSWLIPCALLALGAFWRAIEAPSWRSYAVTGACCGLLCAIKLSALPFVAAISASVGVGMIVLRRPIRRQLARALGLGSAFAAALVGAFVICVLPHFEELGSLLVFTFGRRDATTATADPWTVAASILQRLWEADGGWLVWTALTCGLALAGGIVALQGRARPRPTDPTAHVARLVLLLASGAMTAMVASKIRFHFDVATDLRQAIPIATALNVGLPLAWHHAFPAEAGSRRGPERIVLILAVLAFTYGALSFAADRRATLAMMRKNEAAATRLMDRVRPPGGRVLVWDGPNSGRFGPGYFHLWGSHFFTKGRHDADVLAAYPGIGLMSVWDLKLHLFGRPIRPAFQKPNSRFGPIGNLVWNMRWNPHHWEADDGTRTWFVRDASPVAVMIPADWDGRQLLLLSVIDPGRQGVVKAMRDEAGGAFRVIDHEGEEWLVAEPASAR